MCFYGLSVSVGLGHMFLLCAARPYVSICWLWAWGSAICFYYAALGHMFLLVGCGRGDGSYVSIMRRWAVCLYWLAVRLGLGHMFLLCGARLYVSIGWL